MKNLRKSIISDVLIVACVVSCVIGVMYEQILAYILGFINFLAVNVYLFRPSKSFDGQLQIDTDDEKKDIFRLVLFEDPDDIRKKETLRIQVLNGVHLE